MFGFGKKKIKKLEKISNNIQVIPEEFYGAKDPTIQFEQVVKKVKNNPKKTFKLNSNTGRLNKFFQNKIVKYSLIAFCSIIIIFFISWYYINQAQKVEQEVIIETKDLTTQESQLEGVEELIIIEEVEPVVEEKIEEVVKDVVTSTIAITEDMLEFPKLILINSPDIDGDALTDIEEEVFNTDSGTWDTDGDGFYDGQEVYNLYNPTGLAPMKIIDAGLVQEYINPIWQYRVYYPVAWQVGQVDTLGNQVLFSSITGDYIELVAFEKETTVIFQTWFGEKAKGQSFSDLQKIKNKFQQDGWKRKDDLVAYFVDDKRVYVLIYNPGSSNLISYRHIMQMMVQSFRPSKTIISIPDQEILPALPNFDENKEDEITENSNTVTTSQENI
ncbi:MAG: hypothetical protein ABIJ23_04195 [Candidatus Magasanikbacteria bacterium]